ncbi:MAG: xanthine dehydrogenase family protein molybdopterin-binding subunit, partial [Xanthobacteraceae bacterium]|nr:xanthine dehydrogenase family protein molybdopterin-binding subunit [Xanthobacteraceae bacterium]
MSALGMPLPRKEDPALLSGRGRYADDLPEPRGTLHAHVIRSPHAYAVIRGIDASAARRLPGVAAVITGEEVRALTDPFLIALKAPVHQWSLAVERVRYVGEAVAAVVANSRANAERAAELVAVTYDVLPPVTSAEAALHTDAPLIAPEWGDNILFQERFREGEPELAAARCRTISGKVSSQRISGAPLEPRGIIATWDPAALMIRMWESTQQPHLVRTYVAQALGISENQVSVTQPQVGGAFGLKQPTSQEEVLIAYLALRLRRPVRWIEQR